MANTCHNIVKFTGPTDQLIKLNLMFAELKLDLDERYTMGLPDFVQADSGHLFDIEVGKDGIWFSTRWVPNLEVIQQIGAHFGLDYVHSYHETAMAVLGEAFVKNGEFHHCWLTRNDQRAIGFNEDGSFSYQGRNYDDDIAIWFEILEHKKQKHAAQNYVFETTGFITAKELSETYGPLLSGDLFLKLAQHKNFEAAEAVFDHWDEESVIQMENFLIGEYRHMHTDKFSQDDYIAVKFLDQLISDRHSAQAPKQEQQPGLKR